VIATLILTLTPWAPELPADQIWMGEGVDPIKAEVIETAEGRRFCTKAGEWVQLKRRAEAMGGYCQDAVNIASSTCALAANELLDKTRREAESTHADQQVVINALENDLKAERAKLLEERKSAERLKWVTIGVGVVAVGATSVALIK
tara:strand:- start:4913 stop:5353 length:441 start_codon:yes stop_codon:yes gene_type:complete